MSLGPKGPKVLPGIRCILKGSMKENVKVRRGGENARIPSVFRKEDSGESEMGASDAIQS